MKNISIPQKVMEYYNAYDLYFAGNVNNKSAFEIVSQIEKKFPVDLIKLADGTRIWNLLRVFFYSNFYIPEEDVRKKPRKKKVKTAISFLKQSLMPLALPPQKIRIYGFTDPDSRRCRNDLFYDIYLDPIHEILGDNFCILEWPTSEGHRRKYNGKVFSKNYVPIHISLKTIVEITFKKLFGKISFSIEKEDILEELTRFFARSATVNYPQLKKDLYDYIIIFFYVKKFITKMLRTLGPEAVILRCGYGRLHMALSQACKELSIPSIEVQHGIITNYHIGYVKSTRSKNKDCIPDYLLTYGDIFSHIVKKGNLFDPGNVISTGFPYIEDIKISPSLVSNNLKNFISSFSATVLITSQWILSDKIEKFVIDVSKELDKKRNSVGIVFKPHPRDSRDYAKLRHHKNIFLASNYDDTYEVLKSVDIHSTVYSTTGIDSYAFAKPNIFIDIGLNIKNFDDGTDENSPFIAKTPHQFVKLLEYIIINYDNLSKKVLDDSTTFFKKNSRNNFIKVLNSIGVKAYV